MYHIVVLNLNIVCNVVTVFLQKNTVLRYQSHYDKLEKVPVCSLYMR